MEERLPFDSELISRIDWLIMLRWWAVVGTALAIAMALLAFPGTLPAGALLSVTAAIALYNLILLLYLRSLQRGEAGAVRLQHATQMAYAQIALDLAALAALVHFAGGVESPIWVFFVFHAIIASILLRRAASYLAAGLATLLFAAVAGLEYAGVLQHHHLPFVPGEGYLSPLYVFVSIAALALTLALVVYLTGSISIRLRQRDRALFESNSTCQVRSVELAELNEQLRRLDAERTRFMLLVTHELRAPISTIYSALQLVRAGYTSPPQTEEMLERAQSRASELLTLIGELLDLTKVREQTVHWQSLTPIQVADVLRNVVEFMSADATRHNLSLVTDIAPDLAPVRAVPDQMKLVWTNLLSNAIKYNQPGGSVVVSLSQDERQVIGQVRDTGIGIAREDMPRLFEEFYRAGNAKLVSPHGTGVGLAIVRRIIESWGGTITVQSELGHGTTFTFFLPRSDVDASPASEPAGG